MGRFYLKYKRVIRYLIFGILTTLVNIVSYGIAARCFLLSTLWSTLIAWVISVSFAYVTNCKFVFESKVNKWVQKFTEIAQFFSCRIVTGILDLIIMFIFVDLLNINDLLIKCVANIIVIIANYIASKRIIFKN